MPVMMSKEERQLRQQFTQKKQEARNLLSEGKDEEARSMLDEAKSLQKRIEMMSEERELDAPEIEDRHYVPEQKRDPESDSSDEERSLTGTQEYRNAWFKVLTGRDDELGNEERKMLQEVLRENRQLSSKSDKDGGYTVPDDISKQIIKSIQELNSVRNLVRVVPKTAPGGSYPVRKGAAGKLYNIAEKEAIKELKNMEFDQITYNVKKFAGFLPIPNELLNDSFINFVREIVEWLSESATVTENDEVFYGKGGENNVEGIITSKKYKSLK
ncbi:phage major capsid protein, partial [Bacillus safensis]